MSSRKELGGQLGVPSFAGIFLAAVLLASCGGSDSAVTDERGRAEDLAAKVEEQLGLDDGFDAVIFAWERGYSHPQVFDAIDGARLQADGFLTAKSGDGTEQPAESPLGRVLLPDSAIRESRSLALVAYRHPETGAGVSYKAQEPLISVDEIRKAARKHSGQNDDAADRADTADTAGIIVLTLISALAFEGYSAEQIIDSLILTADSDKETVFKLSSDGVSGEIGRIPCSVLRDATGQLIVPAFGRGDCFSAVKKAAEDEARQREETEKDPQAGFVVVVPPGNETCSRGDITDVKPMTLTFGGDGTLGVSGSVTCTSEGTAFVATLTGAGTWDAETGTYEVEVSFGSESLGFTPIPLSGKIDLDNGTIELQGDVLRIDTTGQ